MSRSRGGNERGQATVELALLAPILVLVALFVGQLLILARDRIVVVHMLREAAIAMAVADDRAAVLAEIRQDYPNVSTTEYGDRTIVALETTLPTDLPLIGRFIPDVTIHEQVEVARRW